MENKDKITVFAVSMGSGGAEKVISLILKKLTNDFDVTLVLFYNIFHFTIPSNLKVIVLMDSSNKSWLKKILFFPFLVYKYIKFIKSNRIKLSISFLTRPNFVNGLLKIFLKNKVWVVMSERNYPSIEYKSSKLRFLLYKMLIPWLYNKADVLFSNSLWINEDLMENFNVKTRMEVIYNPIILPEIRKEFEVSDNLDLLKFVSVGRLISTKNHESIIRAFKQLNSEKINLNIIGDGNLKTELLSLTNTLGLNSNIKFWGNIKNVEDVLVNFDVFILSSKSEGFPNALLEAMSIGLPLISTNCLSGPLEMLNDNESVKIPYGEFVVVKYGLLVNVDDEVGLAKAIEYFKNNKSELRRLSELSLLKAKKYSLDNIYIKFKEILNEKNN